MWCGRAVEQCGHEQNNAKVFPKFRAALLKTVIGALQVAERKPSGEDHARTIFAATMSIIPFAKWQGTGNDFILVDDRSGVFPHEDHALVRRLCDRHFGIGSDGLILLQGGPAGTSYHMEFFNPDASRSFCGNGSRCAFAFWSELTGGTGAVFTAIDGRHTAEWRGDRVAIGMRDVAGVEELGPGRYRLDTGSPHVLVQVEDPAAVDVVAEGRRIRYDERFRPGGVNVNFMALRGGRVEMRTYERGVEAETLSCGTGVTAAALGAISAGLAEAPVQVRTTGGDLEVEATRQEGGFREVQLIGPVRKVFTGTFTL